MTELIKPYYIFLTGSKNNAGDFLIKYRAKQLFEWLRPDRGVIDIDAWKPFDAETLQLVNESKAVILLGGPALQENMRPKVYALIDDLDKIKVPIITLGIGWYSHQGRWIDTHNYPLSDLSIELLDKIEASGYKSSVRDYHTLNVLNQKGYKQFVMTGCPALYSRCDVERPIVLPSKIEKVAVSLGVSLKNSKSMFLQMQEVVLLIVNKFPDAKVEVVFHHALDQSYMNAHGATKDLHEAQQKFLIWLNKLQITAVDISGSAEKLMQYYEKCDLHIGYRVHAHIFMSSISKPSVLLNEDGRGIALRDVVSGGIIDAYTWCTKNIFVKALHKFSFSYDDYKPDYNLVKDLSVLLDYELRTGVKLYQPRDNIKRHFPVMKNLIGDLP